MQKPKALPWIAFAAVCFFWGTTAPAIRVAVRYFPPLVLSGVRFAIAGSGLLAVLVVAGKGPNHWRVAFRRSVPGGLALAFANALTCWGFVTVQSGQGALLLATTALWMTLIDSFWRGNPQTTSKLVWLGTILGLLGVALLVEAKATLLGVTTGSSVLLISSLGWAYGSVWQSKHPSHLPPVLEAALQMLIASAVLLPAAYAVGERWNSNVTETGWLAFYFLIITGSLIGFVSFVFILRNLSPKIVGLYTYVNPLVATWAGWWWLGERVRPRFWLASAAILGSVALVRLGDSRSRARGRGPALDSALPPA